MLRGEHRASRGCENATPLPQNRKVKRKGGGMKKQFIDELAFAFDRLNQRLEKTDFPEGVLFYEYPVQCNGKFLRLGVEIESGKFYLQGDGIDGKIQTILL
jgi:hypothetical protein